MGHCSHERSCLAATRLGSQIALKLSLDAGLGSNAGPLLRSEEAEVSQNKTAWIACIGGPNDVQVRLR